MTPTGFNANIQNCFSIRDMSGNSNAMFIERPELPGYGLSSTSLGVDDMDFDYEIPQDDFERHNSLIQENSDQVSSTPNALLDCSRASRPTKHTTCPHCGRQMLKRTLARHVRSVHNHQGSNSNQLLAAIMSCFECGKLFARKDNLARHMSEKHGDETGTIECLICGSYVRERAFNGHQNSMKCKRAQRELASCSGFGKLIAESMASIKRPGRFNASTVANPLVIAIHLSSEFVDYRELSEIPLGRRTEFHALQGMALRTTRRAVNSRAKHDCKNAAFALFIMCFPLRNDPRLYEDKILLLKALVALENRFQDPILDPDYLITTMKSLGGTSVDDDIDLFNGTRIGPSGAGELDRVRPTFGEGSPVKYKPTPLLLASKVLSRLTNGGKTKFLS